MYTAATLFIALFFVVRYPFLTYYDSFSLHYFMQISRFFEFNYDGRTRTPELYVGEEVDGVLYMTNED